ncbi:hypothetical protein KKG52_01110 [Patescibacteria group bacterium]|nr:hypothetical protein [Patescibacteria group bacterium]
MKRLLPILITFFVFVFSFVSPIRAAAINSVAYNVQVSASVGDFYLNLSGYIAPYASIVLTSNGTFIRATVADENGNFSISQVLIRKGFATFCLQAIDFKRIGESYTCFNIKPATGSITMTDIFLPPTLGLSRTEVAAGGTVQAFGYSMPGALVTLYLSDGRKLTTYADSTGYYVFNLENIKAGKYQMYTKAQWSEKESLEPTKKVELKALNWWEQFIAFVTEIWNKVYDFFTSFSLGPLWLGVPLIVTITTFILKLWPERFTFIYNSKLFALIPFFRKKKKHLHHDWLIGY